MLNNEELQRTPTPTPPKLSWTFMGVVVLVVWILFFNGFGVLEGLMTSPTATTIYQTATAEPLIGGRIVPTMVPMPAQGAQPAPFTAPPIVGPSVPLVPLAPPMVPTISGIAQNEATSQAMYQATAAAAAVVPVGDTTGSGTELKPADRILPTLVPAIAPVNIQATHTCLHGQVWVDDKGCRWPDGRFANRHP